MTIQHGYQTFYRIWLISLLVLIAAACGGALFQLRVGA